MIRRLTVVVTALLVLGAGCEGDTPMQAIQASSRTEVAPTQMRPDLALAYEPGDGQTDRAIATTQAALRAHPESVEAHLALATVLMRRGRETSQAVYRMYAEDVLASARARSPSHPRARLMSTMLLLDGHKFEAAVTAAEDLAGVMPADPTPKILLGDATLELGRYEQASDAYQSAIDLRPDLRSYNRAAYMRWLYGDFESAVQIMELALDSGSLRDPEAMAWCFTDLAEMFLAQGDERRARASAERALSLVPRYAPANISIAKVMQRTGQSREATALVEQSVAVRANAADYLLLSELYAGLGDDVRAEKARASAETLTEHDPRPLAEYLARRGESPKRALALAEQELGARRNIWAHDTHALALARVGRIDQARDAMAKARALGTRSAEFALHGALIELGAGRSDLARAGLEEALSIDAGADPLLVAEIQQALGSA